MILESVLLEVKADQTEEFERDFALAIPLLTETEGFIAYELHKCNEMENKYLFQVKWENLSAHTDGFRKSPRYEQWSKTLHHYYDPFPTVEHFVQILSSE